MRVTALLLGLILVARVRPAEAQPSEQETAAARALFAEGRQLADEERWVEAEDRLRRALSIRSSPALRYNLGLALVRLGRFVEAVEHLREAIRTSAERDAARTLAETLLRETERKIAHLTIQLDGDGDGVEVLLDGRPLAEALIGVAVPVDPGTHAIALTRGGREIAGAQATLREGETSAVRVAVPVAPAELPAEPVHVPTPPVTEPEPLPLARVDWDRPTPAPVREERGRNVLWLIGAAAAVGAGLLVDNLPHTSRNDTVEPLDFVPVGLYALAGTGSILFLAKF